MHRHVIWVGLWFVACGSATCAAAGPTVFWVSDPIRPGEAAMVIGEDFGDRPAIVLGRLADGDASATAAGPVWSHPPQPVEPLQASAQAVKFVVPASLPPGVFAYRLTTTEGSVEGLLNRPAVWWAQGDLGEGASPGGEVQFFGKNLTEHVDKPRLGPAKIPVPRAVRLQGPRTVTLATFSLEYRGNASLPSDLPPGKYELSMHSGWGGATAWSEPVSITVAVPPRWPEAQFNVTEFGAEGDGVKDDTAAVLAALEEAKSKGGGVVYFPRGRYRLSDGLMIPRFTVVRGESDRLLQRLVALCWIDLPQPPEALLRGTNSFGLENLTVYACNHRHVICGDLGDVPDAGDVFLRNVLVRADAYRGHLKPEEVDARFRDSLRYSTGGGDTVRLGGRNVHITDCDFYGSGRALFLSRVRDGCVSGNRFHNGRWGWYCISGTDGLIFENNEVTGADLMSTGGGLNCLDGSSRSQNVYFANNRLSLMHGWDREAMTSDAGGEVYFGKIATVDGRTLTLAAEPPAARRDGTGSGVLILAGRGAGQHRRVVRYDGAKVELDQPFAVPPDGDSDVVITMFQGHYLLVDNEFTDTGAMQFYGTSIECLVAGNRGTRMQGFRGLGLWYHGYQPSWFCQFLDNEITEGNYYHFDAAGESMLEVLGARREPYPGPLNRGAVLRRNHLRSNAQIRVAGTCRDVIVEGNRVEQADVGIFVSRDSQQVLVRENQFAGVRQEIVDEEAIRRAAEERLKRFLGRQEPVAVWSFETLVGSRFADSSGNGFTAVPQGGVTRVAEGASGQAVRLDGTGWLRVDEPAVFNAPDITIALWVQPETLAGRRGLVAKRFAGGEAPWVISHSGASVHFEATEENGPWTFNFGSPPALQEKQWTHVAAVVQQGQGVTLYVGGREVARLANAARRAANTEPLILGREAWGGDPPKGDTPGFYIGLLDEIKIWTRPLTADEIRAEAAPKGS